MSQRVVVLGGPDPIHAARTAPTLARQGVTVILLETATEAMDVALARRVSGVLVDVDVLGENVLGRFQPLRSASAGGLLLWAMSATWSPAQVSSVLRGDWVDSLVRKPLLPREARAIVAAIQQRADG